MRIVHLTDYYQPQFGYQEPYLARKQQELGHEVIVVTSDRFEPMLKVLFKAPEERFRRPGVSSEDGILVHRLPILFEFDSRLFLRGLGRVLRDLHPDIVHCHIMFAFTSLMAAWCKAQIGFGLLFDTHASDINTDARSTWVRRMIYRIYRMVAGPVIRRAADCMVAVGEGEKEFLCRELPVDPSSVEIVRLGADKELFKFDAHKRAAMRRRLGFNDEDVVLIYAGKLVPYKDLPTLLDAILPIAERDARLKLLIVGDGTPDYVQTLKRKVQNSALKKTVYFHDYVSVAELPGYYSGADVGVWPGAPSNTILEAMSTGLPVILPRNASNLFLLSNENGFAFDSISELQSGIESLLENPGGLQGMGRRSRQLIEEKLSWGVIAQRFLDLYQEICERSG